MITKALSNTGLLAHWSVSKVVPCSVHVDVMSGLHRVHQWDFPMTEGAEVGPNADYWEQSLIRFLTKGRNV